jgi:hypothetical protein
MGRPRKHVDILEVLRLRLAGTQGNRLRALAWAVERHRSIQATTRNSPSCSKPQIRSSRDGLQLSSKPLLGCCPRGILSISTGTY